MRNTLKRVHQFTATLGLTLGLLVTSFSSQAILLEYDYETVDAVNNEYLFSFEISDLSSFSASFFEFNIAFNNVAGDLPLDSADIIDFGPDVEFVLPLDPGFDIGKTSISDLFFEYFVYDLFFSEGTSIAVFSEVEIDFSTMLDGTVKGISILLTTSILPNDLVVLLTGTAEDSNGNFVDIGQINGVKKTVIQPPSDISSPSVVFLFASMLVLLILKKNTKGS